MSRRPRPHSGFAGSGPRRRPSSGGSRSLESNGPFGKIRGSATQIADRYGALSRDAGVSGDQIAMESFAQYAEHYARMAASQGRQPIARYDRSDDRLESEIDERRESLPRAVDSDRGDRRPIRSPRWTRQMSNRGDDDDAEVSGSSSSEEESSSRFRTRRRIPTSDD